MFRDNKTKLTNKFHKFPQSKVILYDMLTLNKYEYFVGYKSNFSLSHCESISSFAKINSVSGRTF